MQQDNLATRMATAAVAGVAATAAMQALRGVSSERFPEAAPPIRRSPDEFVIEKAKSTLPGELRQQIPERAETAIQASLPFVYGAAFALLYAALRPRGGNVLADGAAVGLAAWAVGYLGWLPASRLVPPVTRQRPTQVLGPMLQHLAFGVATVGAYDALQSMETRLR